MTFGEWAQQFSSCRKTKPQLLLGFFPGKTPSGAGDTSPRSPSANWESTLTLLLVVAAFLAGCGNFWQAPSGSGNNSNNNNNNGGSTTASSGTFYILNNGVTPQIVGESIVSGQLTAISGSPWPLPEPPYSMAISPNGNYLYVSTQAGVYTYPISAGSLGAGGQVTSDTTALAIQVDPSGNWLIEALQTTDGVTLAAVPISPSSGALDGTEVTSTYSVNNGSVQQGQIAISSDDKNVFVALGAGGAIVVPFNAKAAAGVVPFGINGTVIPVTNASGSVLSVAVDPATRLFYVGETLANSAGNSGGLFAFNYSSLGSSKLTQATGSPIASAGLAPNFILPNSNGGYVYVGNGQGISSAGNITGFSITTSGTAHTIVSDGTVAAGQQPSGLAEDSSGTFLLGVNSLGSPYFNAYTFSSTVAGQLTSQITANTGSAPIAVVAAP